MGKLKGPGRCPREEIEIGKYDYDEFDENTDENYGQEKEISFLRELYRDIKDLIIGVLFFMKNLIIWILFIMVLMLFFKGFDFVFDIIERTIDLAGK